MTLAELRLLADDYATMPDDTEILICVEDMPYLPIVSATDSDLGGPPSIPAILLIADMDYA